MRLVRSLAVGFGAGAAILLSATPALADEPSTTPPKPAPTSAPPMSAPGTPESYPAPGEPQVDSTPKGGVQTGGGPVEDDSALLVAGGVGAAAVLGLGGLLVRRRVAGKAS